MAMNHFPLITDKNLDKLSGDFHIVYVTEAGKTYCRCTCPATVTSFEKAKEWAYENFKRVSDSYSKKYVTRFTVERF